MTPQLAAALRSRSPDALPELLDATGDQLFQLLLAPAPES
jgi:hypothetical protein